MNFRRVLTALAMVALFVGFANAQIVTPNPINCVASVASTPVIRSEGRTERVGDIILTCTGGPAPAAGTAADRATIVVDLGVPVTSRPDPTPVAANATEALLIIDEPNTVTAANSLTPGFGPNATYTVCTTIAAGGCPTFANQFGGAGAGALIWVAGNAAAAGSPQAANVYQGTVGTAGAAVNRITFSGVPIVAPVTSNVQRVFRITNVRVNPGSTAAINASVTVTPAAGSATQLSFPGSTTTAAGINVANAQAGLVPSVVSVGGVSSCSSPNVAGTTAKPNLALLKFTEGFAGAFKTRVVPTAAATPGLSTETGNNLQVNVTGIYGTAPNTFLNNSESGLVIPVNGFTGVAPVLPAGLASSGTRLKAVFAGLDPLATYYVSAQPVIDFQTTAVAPAAPGDTSTTSWAVAIGNGVASETAVFAAAGTVAVNGVPSVQITRNADGTGEVVWEVTNASAGSVETLTFALYATYNASTPPTVGNNATVTLGFAPTQTTAGAASTWIPRFSAPSMTAAKFFNVLPCQTVLLFPFVTNNAGFETGIAISNTSTDPFGTQTSGGNCALNFYGQNQPAAAISVGPVNTGSTYANTVSGNGLVNFQGYMIATCNFQFAHGFAFINDSKQSMAMGYLALVMDNTGTTNGPVRGQVLLGEGFAQ